MMQDMMPLGMHGSSSLQHVEMFYELALYTSSL